MIEVYVDLPVHTNRGYYIYIGFGLLSHLGSFLSKLGLGRRVLLVTNPKVHTLYGNRAEESLSAAGYRVVTVEIPDSEESKSLATAAKLYDVAFLNELDRQCPVVALGGGVVGDLAGFVAATYLRGVPFIQVPTTLLAQVDSSVGGKVAVNHPQGKNIIGAFYQPKLVLADMELLNSLDLQEIRAGLAEVIKYGVIANATFFNWLEKNIDRLLSLEPEALAHAVATSCQIKARIVQEDETEQGRRAILNFGHTVGHAVESLTGYTAYRHGEAVGIGMVVESNLAAHIGIFQPQEVSRIEALVKRIGLPARIPAQLSPGDLLASMRQDKKVLAGKYTFVLPVEMGRVEIFRDIPEESIYAFFSEHNRN